MTWPEKGTGDGKEREQIGDNGFLKGSMPSAGTSVPPVTDTPLQNGFEGKDALSYANILRSRNKFVDALALYESVLEKDSSNVEAHIGKGICLQMQNMGRLSIVLQMPSSWIHRMRVPIHIVVFCTKMRVAYLFFQKRLVQSYQKALRADPSYKPAAECLAIVLTDLGTSLKLAGNTQEGIQKYYDALKIDPHYAPAYYNLGVVYSEMMQYDTALSCYEKAAVERPMYAEAYCNMGVIYKNRGDLEAAMACYERCLAVSPNFEIAKNNMAIALTDLGTKVKLEGDINQGVAYYKKALYYNWHYADAMYNLGVAYGEMLKFDMAIVFYELAFHFNPHCAEACNNLGVIYKDRDNLDKAVECYQAIFNLALSIKPNFSQSLNNLGVVYTVQGKMDAAASMIQKAILANPTYAEAYNNLGVLYRDAGNITLAIEAYEQCLKIDPDSRNAGQVLFLLILAYSNIFESSSPPLVYLLFMLSVFTKMLAYCLIRILFEYFLQNRLLAMNYINEGHDDKLFEAHRDWGRRFMRLYSQYTLWDNSKVPDRPLVIGYVSPDYFTHSVSYFIEAPLVYHDYANYRVVVYSAVVKADAKTNKFREKVITRGGIWRDIYGIDEKKVASMVREDKVDILVELTGHTANNKLGMMACRPAPVQVTWIGYPNTTGLPTIDYRITDSLADPPDTKQKHVEELVRLPECFLCYTPSPEAGPICPTPALSNGFVTFGSFNNLAKITPKVLQVWARILCAVPNSRLVVKCKPFCCDSVRQRFLSTLEQLGLESLRVDLLPLILLNHDHMQAYSLMDISLDTFPYAGTTTTCESLYMGVPCVTMAGSVHAHNVGVSLLSKVGLGHLIAKDEDQYVKLALQLASDVTVLSNLRMSLRDLMSKSPVCNGQQFTLGLESKYRNMWHRYCKGDVPSLRRLEMLQHQGVSEETPVNNSGVTNISISRDSSLGSIKTNGFSSVPSPMLNLSTCEENGKQPRGGINRWLHWLPVLLHKKVDHVIRRFCGDSQFQLTVRGNKVMLNSSGKTGSSSVALEGDAKQIASLARATFNNEGPLLVVASGRDTIPVASSIKRLAPENVFVVQIQHPRSHLNRFDLVITPRHDYYPLTPQAQEHIPWFIRRWITPCEPPDRHVVLTVGALHQADSVALRSAASVWRDVLSPLPKPLLVVNFGGPTSNCPYDAGLAKQLADMLWNVLWSCGSLRISFSRRTPENVHLLEATSITTFDFSHSLLIVSFSFPTTMSTTIDIQESSSGAKAKAISAPTKHENGKFGKGIAVFDFILRLCAIVPALAAAAAMATSSETLPFFTQFFQFQASYDDLPTFQFFVIAMALVGGYLVLSLPFSIVTIIRPRAAAVRLLLLILDTVALTLATSAGAAAAAIVYLAHNGNPNTNWLAICNQFGDFCQKVSGAVVASFVAVVVFVFLVLLSGLALRRH
ncbi:LOW QUALITY PROTEIN: DUF588 domain-containing protein/Mito_fiss_Elm1 domain-containing protein/TPR_2 domain-containing protein/Sel1 domain-containing protein/TPR_11 domain-containing protein/TPR_12 domain-containing protein/Glyco_transf_41 domain-containing protein [Cephalotus follicularis]|uniref:Probable UDP-N-acetylglucosamine--peptide N-acetylglucosaminyltransferase SPINDLY n=2 Tax=Magnoliopsida TaxID=3398 RepID=A0A1Q3AV39_CEPFO|nr:LOW QUALITY PROTEIN: DUF588 domain-containing protein/Mito_fiss_Elm1 domain-containing protein/TPR_2 domain-containing protein/Sel1 domain-containing protein/TPR_11 domain-containing protein/TPR_12 domain-containing protein/Glyco_transf_41 domain-containing protein [Cephalotus follicularis]